MVGIVPGIIETHALNIDIDVTKQLGNISKVQFLEVTWIEMKNETKTFYTYGDPCSDVNNCKTN